MKPQGVLGVATYASMGRSGSAHILASAPLGSARAFMRSSRLQGPFSLSAVLARTLTRKEPRIIRREEP